MKTMTCKQLGGACDFEFKAETFEEMAEQSKAHGIQMFEQQDPAHLEAMDAMKDLMQRPGAFAEWFEQRKKEFEALPED